MMHQLRRYRGKMVLLIILGILLAATSQMGAGSTGFLLLGIIFIVLGIALYTLVLVSGRRRQ